jgi:hypothetical protein
MRREAVSVFRERGLRAPTSALISKVARPSGLSQGRSRILSRSRFDRVLPDIAGMYRCVIRRTLRVGVRHANHSRRILISCTSNVKLNGESELTPNHACCQDFVHVSATHSIPAEMVRSLCRREPSLAANYNTQDEAGNASRNRRLFPFQKGNADSISLQRV